MLCILVCILTHPEGLSKYSTTKKEYTPKILPYYTPKCLMRYTCLYSKRHNREDSLIMHTFFPGGCGCFLANTSLSLGKPSQPPVSSSEVSLSSGLPPSNGSHKAHLSVTVWFWERVRLPDREGRKIDMRMDRKSKPHHHFNKV